MILERYGKVTALTEHDSTVQPRMDALYIGANGNVKLSVDGGTTFVTFNNMIQGTIYPIKGITQIHTDTTATGLVGLEFISTSRT